MIKLRINDIPVEVKQGKTVLDAARANNIRIPTLCYQEDLTPYGGCRLCLVEIEGYPRPITSCTLPCQEGMVVRTDTPHLKELRRFSLELILSEHPYSCLICEKKEDCVKFMICIQKEPVTLGCKYCSKDGKCELQVLVDELEIKELPYPITYRGIEVERWDPFFERDYNLCILCNRCVRACNELRNAGVIQFHHRGPQTIVGTAFGLSHLDTACQFCGACVDACPTGAMSERFSKWGGIPEKQIATACSFCSIACGLLLNVRDNSVISSEPDHHPLCVRGRFGISQLIHSPKRVTEPFIKKGKRTVEVEWEEALQVVTEKLQAHKGKTGVIFSPNLTIEALDVIAALGNYIGAERMGTSLDSLAEINEFSLDQLSKPAPIVVLNTDIIEDFSVLLLKIKSLWKEHVPLIVIDPAQTMSANKADIWLQPKPGKEEDLLKLLFAGSGNRNTTGVANTLISEAKSILKGSGAYLFYNPSNVGSIKIPDSIKAIPLFGRPNLSKIAHMNVRNAEEILKDKKIDCLFIIGESPQLHRAYKVIISQDHFLPECGYDIFLPAATFAEINGNIVAMDGKKRTLNKAIDPIGKAKADDWILKEIIENLHIEKVVSEGISRAALKSLRKKVKPTAQFPFHLIIRENNYIYRNKSFSSLMKGFKKLRNDDCIWIHPADADNLKLKNGKKVRIISKDLDLTMSAKITESVPTGMVLAYCDPSLGLVMDKIVRLECIES